MKPTLRHLPGVPISSEIRHDRRMTTPVHFVSLLFPGITQLDLTGPAQVFSRLPGAAIHLAWHRTEPVPTDAGFSILPTVSFEDAPQADVLMVPGGQGAFELLEDAAAPQAHLSEKETPGAGGPTECVT